MKRLALLGAAVAALICAGSVLAGGGTGISATSAATKTFAGTYQATFVRSASGLINETNRINTAGPQNGWTSLDVWLQFRPLTGPDGTGSPKPDPNCEGPTVTPPFVYVNSDSNIGGTASSGYFIGSNRYNVCVYLVHSYATDLSVAPNPVIQGHDVVFTSHLLVDGTPSATPPATIKIHAYDTDSTCTTEAGYGPFATSLAGTDYTTVSLTASAAPGTYYYRAEATFATPALTRWSACTPLVISPHAYALTLLTDGQPGQAIDVGHQIDYSGTATDGPYPVGGAAVTFTVWNGVGCVGSPLYTGISGGSTDALGDYDFVAGPSPAGVYSVEALTANATSNCVDVTVGETAAVQDVTASPGPTTFTCDGGATGGTATSSTVYWYRNQVTGDVTAVITLTGAAASSTFDVWVEQNPGTCPPGTSTPSNPAAITTDASGDGTVTITFTSVGGATNFWLSLWTPGYPVGTQVLRSVAVSV